MDFAPKFWLTAFTVLLVFWDCRKEKRLDYLWVGLVGGFIWTLAELALQVAGARVMPVRELYGITLPLHASVLLQGIAEGAFVAVFSLFTGDRMRDKQTRTQALTLFLAIGLILLFRAIFPAADSSALAGPASRRNILAPRALAFLACATTFNIIFWLKYKDHRRRTLAMVLVMLVLVTLWSAQQVYVGGRWVETYNVSNAAYERASTGVFISALVFDIFFEMIMAYVPFFAIPVMLGWIKNR